MEMYMDEWLRNYLWCFIRINNPELALRLEDEDDRKEYLISKVETLRDFFYDLKARKLSHESIEELCINKMTVDLRPSRFNYIVNLLHRQFPHHYAQLLENGIVKITALAILGESKADFERYVFSSEHPDYDSLYCAILLRILQYIQGKADNNHPTVSETN